MTRRRRARGWVVISLMMIGTLMPSETSAEDALDVETRSTVDASATALEVPRGTDAEREHVELSFGIASSLGGLGAVGGLGGLAGGEGLSGLQGVLRVPVALDVALPLGSRALLGIGGGGSYAEGGGVSALAVQIPLSVLCYLDQPRTGAFVPIVRVLVRGSYFEMHGGLGGSAMLALGAGARGGLTYLFDDAIGVRAELGAGLDATLAPEHTRVALDLEGALTLVLRT